jgi:hypothetical protein
MERIPKSFDESKHCKYFLLHENDGNELEKAVEN